MGASYARVSSVELANVPRESFGVIDGSGDIGPTLLTVVNGCSHPERALSAFMRDCDTMLDLKRDTLTIAKFVSAIKPQCSAFLQLLRHHDVTHVRSLLV